MASKQQYIQLARTLPPQLTRFLARYPPASILSPQTLATTATPTPAVSPTSTSTADAATSKPTPASAVKSSDFLNPFQSQKSPLSGRWHDPVYSLRRQADLVKLARKHGVESLLPFTVKKTEEKLKKRLEGGLRVKGTGVGESVKGKIDERTLKARLEKRRQAMLAMPALIQEWKEKGHGRGWKKWPK